MQAERHSVIPQIGQGSSAIPLNPPKTFFILYRITYFYKPPSTYIATMAVTDYDLTSLTASYDDNPTNSAFPQRSHALSNKLNSILSTSFADVEIREALRTLDERQIRNSPETRRWLRLDTQKEVIDCNSDIIKDFGHVAEVCRQYRRPNRLR